MTVTSNTTVDQSEIAPFQCEHYSWPTSPGGVFADLVILPLPAAASYSEIGARPIDMTEWNSINTTGKILLIGQRNQVGQFLANDVQEQVGRTTAGSGRLHLVVRFHVV